MRMSTFKSRGGDALHKMALENDKDDQHRNKCNQGCSEHLSPFSKVLALKKCDGNRQGALAGILDRHVRPGKFLPAVEECINDHNRKTWQGKRQDDLPEDRPCAAAIDTGSLFEINGHIFENATQQEGL